MTDSTATAQGVRQDLYEIFREDMSFDEKARGALELGTQYLGVDNGHLTRIDQEGDYWEALISTDPADGTIPPGLELDLGTTYCRRTLESDSQVALHDAPNQGWAADPAFETHGFHCYHGTTLVLNGEPYGTVCFIAEDPRSAEFSDDETMFAELIARLLERELERHQHETEIMRQTNLSTVLNRILRHNLRNDMSVIRGRTQLMADKLDENDAGETALESIDELLALSEKARELDQIIAADFERTSIEIGSHVEDIVESVAREYPSASISIEYDEEITVSLLPSFEQAVRELVENAAKHGGEHPTITLAVENESNTVTIRIGDDGPGLADTEAEVLETGTETPLAHGSGLGLWIAHWIVTSHDGSINSTVTEDGTTMTVSIPRKPDTSVHEQITKLTRARDQYQAGFEEAYDSMVILDDDARIVDANPKAGTILGRDNQELLGQSFTDFLPDDFDFETAWQRFHETGTKRGVETIVGADGIERIVEYSATADIIPGMHLVVSRDITKRKEYETELENRERVLREMYEIMADRHRSFADQVSALLELGRSELDTAYGTLSEIRGDEYVFEVVATDDDSIQAGDVVPVSATNCETVAVTEETLVIGDVERDAPEETDRTGYTDWGISCYIGAPVITDDGVYGTFCFYDIETRVGQFTMWEETLVDLMSRWVSYELQRKQTDSQLQRQNERLERFASVVSHDLRNPLNVLSGTIDLTKETGDLEHLEDAQYAIGRMETLIDDLLTLSRSGDVIGDTEAVTLSSLSNRCWENIATGDDKLIIETDKTVQANRTRLQQLLENLFKNAVEHGGDAVWVGDLTNGFYVADDGSGILEDDRQTVFERGYSTTNEGTGYGLAIVSEVADAHGWNINITDSSDGGARFEFTGSLDQSD